MKDNDAEVIKRARDYIASGKWWKGSARDYCGDEERVCAVIALHSAATKHFLSWEDEVRVTIFVEGFAPPKKRFQDLRPLAAFNDHPNTTLQDVVDLFDKALAELGAHG